MTFPPQNDDNPNNELEEHIQLLGYQPLTRLNAMKSPRKLVKNKDQELQAALSYWTKVRNDVM